MAVILGFLIQYPPFWMEKAMAPHSSTLAWKIPWMEEPGGLQSMDPAEPGGEASSTSAIVPRAKPLSSRGDSGSPTPSHRKTGMSLHP